MVELSPPPTLGVNGILVSLGKTAHQVLLTGEVKRLGRPQAAKSRSFKLRFGAALLFDSDYIFPQLVIDDFARQHHGREGLAFMFDEGDAFPRADVIGVRKSTGATDQLFLKQVDLARNLHCFAGQDKSNVTKLEAVVWLDDSRNTWARLPAGDVRADELLRRSVYCYTTNLTDLDKIMECARSGIKAVQ